MKNLFISDFLTHWTGKDKSEEQGLVTLKAIVSGNQLWLNHCPHFRRSEWEQANLRMTCFTDIPLSLSKEHCYRYGRFGISFKKKALIQYGANPVYYTTEFKKDDAVKVYDYICDANTGNIVIEDGVLESLKRFFGFVQDYSFNEDTFYYEREWRILQNNLEYREGDTIPPGTCGSFNNNGKQQFYFQFKKTDIERIITPNKFKNEIISAYGLPTIAYEELVA